MSEAVVDVACAGGVTRVFLNRPDVRNALNDAVIGALDAAFAAIAVDPDVRAVVVGGRGKAFCAGGDLAYMREVADHTWEQNFAGARKMAELLFAIDRCPVPVVARIHGDCYAGGLGVAAACDIRVAADDAGFRLSEVKLGLIPATIGPYVVRAMGEAAARRWFVTAERFDAREARAIGFVHETASADALDGAVDAIVDAVVGNAPIATRASKKLVLDVAGREIDATLRAETARRIADLRAGDEGRDGVQSFLEKRKPGWLAR